jgi:hypothetical protein
MDDNVVAVLQAVFHLVLVAVFHGGRAQPGFKSQRKAKPSQDRNPIGPRVRITNPLKP